MKNLLKTLSDYVLKNLAGKTDTTYRIFFFSILKKLTLIHIMAEINAWSFSTSVFSAFPAMLTEAALTPGGVLKNWNEMAQMRGF